MATYEKYLEDSGASQDLVDLAKEIRQLREMVWMSHGHQGMYGDDGELQCSQCATEYGFYDWKRTPLKEIQAKIFEGNLIKGMKHGKQFRATYQLKKEFRDDPECQAAFEYAAQGNKLYAGEINYIGAIIEETSTKGMKHGT